MKAIIVDDEVRSRRTLSHILTKYCGSVAVVDEAGNTAEAFNTISACHPDLVFLDVSLPSEDGFELLKRFEQVFFQVVFVTAYEQYALKALKVSAIDFLLKPLNIAEVVAAVHKVEKNVKEQQHNASIANLLSNLDSTKTGRGKLAVPVHAGLDFIPLEGVVRMEAESNYTRIFLSDGRKILSTRHLKEYEELLPSGHFFRVHHSHIINLNHIVTYHRGDGGFVKMNDGSVVDIAKRKKRDFLAFFNL